MENILKDYYQTKKALEILEKEVEEKKAKILEYLEKTKEKRVETEYATFTVRVTPTYSFSPVVTEAEELIKTQKKGIDSMKKDEIERGVATLERTTSVLVMTQPK